MQPEWVLRTEAVIRATADDLALADTPELFPLVRRSIDRIERPPDPSHQARLCLMLVDFCGTIVRATHARGRTPCSCASAAWEHLSIVTGLDDCDPRTGFRHWAERFLADLAANHPPTTAQEAAALIRSDPGKTWTHRELGHTIGAPHGRLSRQFR